MWEGECFGGVALINHNGSGFTEADQMTQVNRQWRKERARLEQGAKDSTIMAGIAVSKG